jgi:hypothetical protein
MTGSQVDLIAAGLPSVMEGKIVSLRGEDFLARLQGAAGTALDARARLHIDTRTDDVSGELAVTWVGGR